MIRRAYIIAAQRSAVVPANGAFGTLELHQLAAPVLQETCAKAGVDIKDIDEVILANALYGGGNPARLAALYAGCATRVAGVTIDRQCVGGLDAILQARDQIIAGSAQMILAGGGESTSRRPQRLRTFTDGRTPQAYDRPPFTPWADKNPDLHVAADALGIAQQDQDIWAVSSHQKAQENSAVLAQEITSILDVDTDPYARDLTLKTCQRAPKIVGSISHANTAISADAAAFCLIVSQEVFERLKPRHALEIIAGKTVGADPCQPALAPVTAIKALNINTQDLTHIELMEAYAAQAIACAKGAGLDVALINQRGGALARGHPIGASGAILAVRLFHDMKTHGDTGLASIAAAGGLGTAAIFKRV